MDFLNLARKRHSVRSYKGRGVEEGKLLQILEAGRVAPTAANIQPQRIIVIRSKEHLEKPGKATDIYGAPLALIVCSDKREGWVRPFDSWSSAEVDAAIVTDHMMLEAAALGLGSVWICYFKPDVIKTELNLPDNIAPINILAIGCSAEEPASANKHNSMRKPSSKTVFYEKI